MFGVLDTGVDITIIGSTLFKKVAAVAKVKKEFQESRQDSHTYDQKPFTLDGRMDLDIALGEKTILTPVYMKMYATEQLLCLREYVVN